MNRNRRMMNSKSFLLQLLELFDGYDTAPQEQKKDRLAEAIGHVSELKTIAEESKVNSWGRAMASIQQEERNAILSLPVQSVHGVGPRVAQLLAKKNLSTIEDLLYFLPRRYEDRRTVSRIAETVPGIRQTIVGKDYSGGYPFLRKKKDLRGDR